MTVMVTIFLVLLTGILVWNNNNVNIVADAAMDDSFFQFFGYIRSVHQFAEEDVCGSFQGKKLFYKAVRSKLCHLSDDFVVKFVLGLCEERSLLLDYWVEQLFDMDGDGLVGFYENQHFYHPR